MPRHLNLKIINENVQYQCSVSVTVYSKTKTEH
jgi:hypothetical protein